MFLGILLTNGVVTAQLQSVVDIDQISNKVKEYVSGPADASFHAGPLDFAQFFAGCAVRSCLNPKFESVLIRFILMSLEHRRWNVEIKVQNPESLETIGTISSPTLFHRHLSDMLRCSSFITGDVIQGHYIIRRETSTRLRGIYFENVTASSSEVKNALRVIVELKAPHSGSIPPPPTPRPPLPQSRKPHSA